MIPTLLVDKAECAHLFRRLFAKSRSILPSFVVVFMALDDTVPN